MDLLTITEAAQILRVSVPTVRRQIAAGRLQTIRLGRQIRIPREALNSYLLPAPKPLTAEERARLFPPPTPEELERRRRVYEETMALRATLPSIAPLTTRDLIIQARKEAGASYDPGEPYPRHAGRRRIGRRKVVSHGRTPR